MSDKRKALKILILTVTACILMAFVDSVISPQYFIKSAVKFILFFIVPVIFIITDKQITWKSLFRLSNKNGLIMPLCLGIGVYVLIVGAYFIIGPYFDFSNVTKQLAAGNGIRKNNYIPVAIYISFINSLLEEFFFRGIAFLTLKRFVTKRFAYLFSAAAFSLYHISIISSWFSPFLFLLLLLGLFIAGFLFNWLNEKRDNIYNSWLVHMCANLATNTIGFILFGIL